MTLTVTDGTGTQAPIGASTLRWMRGVSCESVVSTCECTVFGVVDLG